MCIGQAQGREYVVIKQTRLGPSEAGREQKSNSFCQFFFKYIVPAKGLFLMCDKNLQCVFLIFLNLKQLYPFLVFFFHRKKLYEN